MTSKNDKQDSKKKKHLFWIFLFIMLALFAITEQIRLFREGKSLFSSFVNPDFLTGNSSVQETEGSFTPAPGEYGYTNTPKVNVRSDATKDSSKVKRIEEKGTRFEIIGTKTNSKNELWYHVRLADGTTGYILENYVSVK